MGKNERVYLDWASGAPVSKAVHSAFLETLGVFANPSSPHEEGEKAKQVLEGARLLIARLAGTKPDSIIFTSGATESNNIAIHGSVGALIEQDRIATSPHVLYLPTAHASVVETMQALKQDGVTTEPLVITDGAIDLHALREQLRPETLLVSMDLVCGETGTRYDVRNVRRVLDAARHVAKESDATHIASHVVLHVDASQAPLVESFEHTHLGADLITLDAQKVGGVRGIGALIRPSPRVGLKALFQGGGQEQGIRPGTQSPALAAAFAAALTEAHETRDDFNLRAQSTRTKLIAQLTESIPDIQVNVGREYVPHILNVSFVGRDTDYVVMLLSEAGWSVSTKSACETDTKGSRAVLALTGSEMRALSTLRISWGPTTKDSQLEKFAEELIRSIAFLDTNQLGTNSLAK